MYQLAVFRGGAPLSAVVATAARGQLDAARVTQLLGALVDKSILTASFPDGGARYDLLDTVREYTLEQLAKAGSLSAAQLVHAGYFATVADAARTEASRARVAGLDETARAGARQPLGCPHLCT